MSLSPELETFAAGPADLATARALTYDRAGGLALVKHLTAERLRSHLEALGEVASDKDVKKAARAAAYKLKSAGVQGGVQREATIDLSLRIETERIAMATAPGFDGHLWIVVPALPGAGGGEIDLRSTREGPRVDPIPELAIGRIRKLQAELVADRVALPPVLADLDLAARLVDHAVRALEGAGGHVPPALDHFRAWRDRALELGAKPEGASARAVLGPAAQPLPEGVIDLVAGHPLLGFLAAPATAFDAIDKEFRALLHGDEAIDKESFLARGEAMVGEAAERWARSESGRGQAATWLDATADVLMAVGELVEARLVLGLADGLRAWDGQAPLSQPLVKKAFFGAVDLEAAWMHREAHMRGEAHH